jgi:thymidylate kinase
LTIAKENPKRVHTIDADDTRAQVQNSILFALSKQFPELAGKVGA